MEIMYDYNYSKVINEYIDKTESKLDPLESRAQYKKIYLNPAFSTKKEPPELKENEVAIFQDDNWIIKSDYRKQKFYKKDTKEEIIITEIGIEPDDSLTELKPDVLNKWDSITNNWIDDEELILKKEELEQKIIIEEKIKKEMRKIAINNLSISGELTETDLILINEKETTTIMK